MNKIRIKFNSGFTVVELMVVLAIVGIVTSIVIFKYSSFKASTSLENVSQDVALTIRKAQVSAIGVKGVVVGTTTRFPSFGVSFSLDSSNGLTGDEKSFIYFADLGGSSKNGAYDPGTGSCPNVYSSGGECMDKIKITTLDKIHRICFNDNCYEKNSLPGVDIVFSRPYPEASFKTYLNGYPYIFPYSISSVKIQMISPEEKIKTISVWNTGQISVQ